ncbi:2-oxo-Delta(3)-4,5,5-trimethylcyclopentenylacetyl-CoA monooxygenase [Pseudocercospora fuligena]|uniref:2-oxo-Delta(3)-4,5, 5-trimethylcyclopentenylacetyl-CoA monooxygenase n=1 Tax=Pseudocercospora fuligena TaxID=685502 RepID=A0A8H6RSY1_9PEZI|nr:2-oxo-Delta(3)-4,5,5-trimethylcyclopentenylacetyl-CoA monooxygenase [Pseudocercospora fuligena]
MGSIEEPSIDYDVLIIGAGLSGIFALHRMNGLNLRSRVLEAGSGEGGTWLWNKYPGCRFDSESYTYHFTFDQDVLDEWNWTEHFAPQPETLRYAQFLTDKFNLRKDMQFNTKIKTAHWRTDRWVLTDTGGQTYSSRFLITAMGILNDPTLPNIPGVETFQGEAFHTSRWPDQWSLEGKRVGIIGTGATAIQIIPEIVKLPLKSLTVFQRTANWSAPLRNDKISPEEMVELRKQYPEIHEACLKSGAGFRFSLDTRKTLDVPKAERIAFWEELYNQRGFAKWLGSFADHLTNKEANELYSDFNANKIRARVNDPAVAEKLVPKNHGFGTRRLPLETNYFEVYNDPRVRLVDFTADSPIERIVPEGVVLSSGEAIDVDVMIYATGFDAITGSLTRGIDLRGKGDLSLGDAWENGIETFLGLFVKGFPNMAMIMGPHQAFGNIPRSIQFAVESVTRWIKYCVEQGITYAEATDEGVERWTTHVIECSKGLLANEVDGWLTGVNKNIAGKQKRSIVRYSGTGPMYRSTVNDVADRNWEDMDLKRM